MSKPTLLAGVWGYPWSWKPAVYRVLAGGEAAEIESRTSLEVLIEAYRPERVLVFAADTVAEPSSLREGYAGIRRSALRRLYEWIAGNAERLRGLLDAGRASIEVLPNVGVYNGVEWRYAEGLDPFDTVKALMLLSLYEALVDITMDKPAVRLVLDLTHGINYMPTALYSAALDAAALASLTTGAGVEILVYNSEPFPQGAERPTLMLHLLGSGEARPGRSAVEVASKLPFTARIRGGKVATRVVNAVGKEAAFLGPLNTDAREIVEAGVRLAAIVAYALPLAAAYAAVSAGIDVGDSVGVARDAVDAFIAYTLVDPEAGRVVHRAALSYDGVYSVLATGALARLVKRAYIRALGDDAPCTLEALDDRGVYLDELREIAARMNPLYADFAVTEIERSLSKLEACKCRDGGRPECPGEPPVPVYCGDWPGAEFDPSRLNPRNFLAHGGLGWEAIEATIDQSGVAVRYRDGAWRVIWEKHLYTVVRKIAEGA